jgi:hypothetical protein
VSDVKEAREDFRNWIIEGHGRAQVNEGRAGDSGSPDSEYWLESDRVRYGFKDPDSAGPTRLTAVQKLIMEECDRLADLLVRKNQAYGSSFSEPINVFSRVSAMEQLDVRIDDKINRIAKGSEYGTEDTELDLIGYLILKRVLRNLP